MKTNVYVGFILSACPCVLTEKTLVIELRYDTQKFAWLFDLNLDCFNLKVDFFLGNRLFLETKKL